LHLPIPLKWWVCYLRIVNSWIDVFNFVNIYFVTFGDKWENLIYLVFFTHLQTMLINCYL
jgi:hypothetical protein